MRKGALLLAMLMVAAAPTAVLAKGKKAAAKPKVYSTTPANSNESSARVVRDGVSQIFVPAQSVVAPLQPAAAPKKAKKSKKKAAKKK